MIIQRIDPVSYSIGATILGEVQIPRESEIIDDIFEIDGVRVVDLTRRIKPLSKGYHPNIDYNRYGRGVDLKG